MLSHRFLRFAAAGILYCLIGCCASGIRLSDWRHLRTESPCEMVRFFQLAFELGEWGQAADCLVSDQEDVSGLELWAVSGMKTRELGHVSLQEILIGAYFIDLISESAPPSARAVVAVMTHPRPSVDMHYNLALISKKGLWFIHLDRTLALNLPMSE